VPILNEVDIKNMSRLEQWGAYFTRLVDDKKLKGVPMLAAAMEAEKVFTADEIMRYRYQQREKFWRDQLSLKNSKERAEKQIAEAEKKAAEAEQKIAETENKLAETKSEAAELQETIDKQSARINMLEVDNQAIKEENAAMKERMAKLEAIVNAFAAK